ncbi:MAG: DUF4013 domain-containing protein [Gemmataceae bacterium]
MQYGLAFNYIIGRTGGWTNLLLITVCTLIPVLGPIVLLGYQAEVAIALMQDEERRGHKDFNFDRFMEYLTRGLWPFLMSLVVSVAIIPLFFVFFILGGVAAAAAPDIGFVFLILGYFLAIGVTIALSVFTAPMHFHAGLANKFDFGAAFRFTKSFWSTVGMKALGSWLVFVVLSMGVALVGLLACFVGIYPASALIQMASQHLHVQLYDEYLDRGGEPIEIAPIEKKSAKRKRRRDDDEDYEDDEEPRRRRRERDEEPE